ncbi:hypothetical protein OAR19_00555 [bacterium]|nr:hypothetical protein [bacterium]
MYKKNIADQIKGDISINNEFPTHSTKAKRLALASIHLLGGTVNFKQRTTVFMRGLNNFLGEIGQVGYVEYGNKNSVSRKVRYVMHEKLRFSRIDIVRDDGVIENGEIKTDTYSASHQDDDVRDISNFLNYANAMISITSSKSLFAKTIRTIVELLNSANSENVVLDPTLIFRLINLALTEVGNKESDSLQKIIDINSDQFDYLKNISELYITVRGEKNLVNRSTELKNLRSSVKEFLADNILYNNTSVYEAVLSLHNDEVFQQTLDPQRKRVLKEEPQKVAKLQLIKRFNKRKIIEAVKTNLSNENINNVNINKMVVYYVNADINNLLPSPMAIAQAINNIVRRNQVEFNGTKNVYLAIKKYFERLRTEVNGVGFKKAS